MTSLLKELARLADWPRCRKVRARDRNCLTNRRLDVKRLAACAVEQQFDRESSWSSGRLQVEE